MFAVKGTGVKKDILLRTVPRRYVGSHAQYGQTSLPHENSYRV